jgi:hypothetical protein
MTTAGLPPDVISAIAAFAGGLAGGYIAGSRKVKKTLARIAESLALDLAKIAREQAEDVYALHLNLHHERKIK